MPAKSVFISHATRDDAQVRELRHSLELLEVLVWTDSENLTVGASLTKEIETNIEKADAFVALLTLNGFKSSWVRKEIKYAQKSGKPIIPLLGRDVEPVMLEGLFPEEPVVIMLTEGTDAIQSALPQLRAALGYHAPTGTTPANEPPPALPADLVLELTDPAITVTDGARRAIATARLVYHPADGGRAVEGGRYTFTAPLGPIEAGELAWYLERYINWPSGYFEQRATSVVDALPKWGRLLYDSVNAAAARNALDAWSKNGSKTDTPERRFTVKVDKKLVDSAPPEKQNDANEAATLLLGLPWELIHDEHVYLFQGARPVRVRRSLPNSNEQPAFAAFAPIRVLLVSPRPEDDSAPYIDHRSSARPLVEALAQLGSLARFKLLDPCTFPALEAELARAARAGEPYDVVHFDGHGVYDRKHGLGQLCFEDPADVARYEARRSQLIPADEIARIVHQHRIPLFFLEACQTAQAGADPGASVAARLLESGVASVAAMSHSVLVESARIFITAFYQELLHGARVGKAMLAGQRALKANTFRGRSFTGDVRLHDWFVPVLFQEEQDPKLIQGVPADAVARIIAEQRANAVGDVPQPPHEFLGRSRDLLKAERMLAHANYIVVRGAGGEGKTTFAGELARWLVATQRFHRATFTSVEMLAEARPVLFSIGGQLVPHFASQAGTDDAHGLLLVERALREHRTVIVIDNVESILASGPDEILRLCAKLAGTGETRVVFTTREALPEPFAGNELRIGRLDRDTAIRLLGNLLPHAPQSDETEQDLENLVEAVGGHARSLVLIAREVGAAGVRHATQNLVPVLRAIEAKNPGDRENSLLASAELSLRRLPPEIRQAIRPLSVFQGGGGGNAIALALKLDNEGLNAIVHALIDVGLAEYVEPQYLRFDPALLGVDLAVDEREAATEAWGEAMAQEIQFLSGLQFTDPNLANNLTLLELPNFLAALIHLARSRAPETVVDVATRLEALVAKLDHPRALTKIVELRTAASGNLPEWSHTQFLAENASVDRLIGQGRHSEAAQAARALHLKCEAAGDAAYVGAAYDGARAQFKLGRALRFSGNAEAAIPHLEQARERFERLNETGMAGKALAEKGDCLLDLGRYNEAADAHLLAVSFAEQGNDPRGAAVSKGNLATVRLEQKNYPEALRLHSEVREIFERLNEPAAVAVSWHQIGRVYQEAGQFEPAEDAYQKSLTIKVRIGARAGQAATLNQLGLLYSSVDRCEEAIRLYRQAADLYVQLGDLLNESRVRSNAAIQLVELNRFDEARREIERAVECKRPFGHAAEPWKTFAILSNIERAAGNHSAALEARNRASAAYLAYRRDGGAPQVDVDTNQLAGIVEQDRAAARDAVADPEIPYRIAAEITLILDNT
jgi:tetratricopeptide (TPR) repeat protein